MEWQCWLGSIFVNGGVDMRRLAEQLVLSTLIAALLAPLDVLQLIQQVCQQCGSLTNKLRLDS